MPNPTPKPSQPRRDGNTRDATSTNVAPGSSNPAYSDRREGNVNDRHDDDDDRHDDNVDDRRDDPRKDTRPSGSSRAQPQADGDQRDVDPDSAASDIDRDDTVGGKR